MPEYATRQQQRQQPVVEPPRAGGGRTAPRGGSGVQLRQGSGTDVVGPIGRVFNRILGLADDAKGTATRSFNKKQLQRYLDKKIQLAEDEWFRGKKLSGVADKLMKSLDKDGDGKVGWPEFQAFQAQVLEAIAAGTKPGDPDAKVKANATKTFGGIDSNRDGSVNYDELFKSSKAGLEKGTEHADLIAQLGARIALDAVDTDERSKKTRSRSLSRAEWTTAASEMAQ